MKDLIDGWLDALGGEYPTIFEDDVNRIRIGSVMAEYFHVYFNPDTFETELFVECGDPSTYASPAFIEKARLMAQEYHKNCFIKIRDAVLDLMRVASGRDIVPQSVIVPKWAVRDSQPRNFINEHFRNLPPFRHLYGIPISTHDKNTVRLESPEFGFLAERPI